MPVTTNYGWTMPTEGGDSGTWDTILNALFAAIDEEVRNDLFSVNDPLICAASGEGRDTAGFWTSTSCQRSETATGNPTPASLTIPLPHLRVGQRITGFTSFGNITGSRTATVSLHYVDVAGTNTQVSAGHSLPSGAMAATSTAGLTHDVATARAYYIKVTPSGGSGSDSTNLVWVRVAVSATP